MLEHIIKSLILAVGLVIDSFSISLINGISYQEMKKNKLIQQSTVFGICQGLMPFIGYLALVYFSNKLSFIKTISPFISLILLSYLGIKLLIESSKKEEIEKKSGTLLLTTMIMQGIATSIDAISCSFSMINLSLDYAVIEVLIISSVTFIVSYTAINIGKVIGSKVGKYSKILGGIVLIMIGIILFIRR